MMTALALNRIALYAQGNPAQIRVWRVMQSATAI